MELLPIRAVVFGWEGVLYKCGTGPFNDAFDTLLELRDRYRIPLGISYTARNCVGRKKEIENSSLKSFFDNANVMISADNIEHQYLALMKQLGAFDRQTALVESDLSRINIGKQINMPVFLIQRNKHATLQQSETTVKADHIITSLTEILDYV